jgi:broad specificity phosphatase PhoE
LKYSRGTQRAVNTVFFVRHGENWANITREFSYQKVDYSLTTKGIQQAQQTADYLYGLEIDEIYCSPLKRAVTPLETFREINVGELEDRPPSAENWRLHDDIVAAWQQGKTDIAFPSGENYIQLLQRMRTGLCTIGQGKSEKKMVIIGHAGILSTTIQDICPHAVADKIVNAPVENCSITQMEICQNMPIGKLIMWANTTHLVSFFSQ